MSTDLTDHWRRTYENKYLGCWDLWSAKEQRYKTVTAKIARVTDEEVVQEGGRKSRPLVLYLAGSKGPIRTPMIVSKVSGKTLEAMFGPKPADWVGKEVTLYANKKRVRGGEAYVLTIRSTRGNDDLRQQLAEPPPPPAFEDDDGVADDPDRGP